MIADSLAMLNAVVVSIRFILLLLCGQKQVALENAALRHQLAVFKRNVPRPKLNNRDRLFWIGLHMVWQDWKSALIQLDTTNHYAQANIETKRKALEQVDPTLRSSKLPRWNRNADLLAWLDSL